jgi:hypothetical protein
VNLLIVVLWRGESRVGTADVVLIVRGVAFHYLPFALLFPANQLDPNCRSRANSGYPVSSV